MHWVRFRRLYRTKIFNPDEFVEWVPFPFQIEYMTNTRNYHTNSVLFIPFFVFSSRTISEKCSQVDSSATNALGQLLLDALTYCSLLHSPKKYSDAVALPLKERILNISIRQPENTNRQTSSDGFYQLDQLRINLETFIENEQATTGKPSMHSVALGTRSLCV